MTEPSGKSSKRASILFATVCIGGITALFYFAYSAVVQSAPPYSTLNSEPDGAKLLFDGIKGTNLLQVSRQFKSLALQKPQHSTVFFLGVDPVALTLSDESYFDGAEESAKGGNRLVIAVTNGSRINLSSPGSKARHEASDRWGVRFRSIKDSHTWAIDADRSWRPWAGYGHSVWQRDFGKGSIILVGEASRLTNAGVAKSEENRQLLQRVISSYSSAVFEEAHLGIRETGSIAGLARHYHLQGLVVGLISLATLFVWSRSVAFPPVPPIEEKPMLGADTRSMLTELMSRHLKGHLMETCVAEWNRTHAHAPAIPLPGHGDAVAVYASIQESLNRKATIRT